MMQFEFDAPSGARILKGFWAITVMYSLWWVTDARVTWDQYPRGC